MSTSIARRKTLAQQAAVDPVFANRLHSIKTAYGDDWDPGNVLARRYRAVRYAASFLAYAADAADAADAAELLQGYFGELRDLLAAHCDPAYARLTLQQALDLLKPKRGPNGPAGLAARWTVASGAFDGKYLATETHHFRRALKDARRPSHRKRAR